MTIFYYGVSRSRRQQYLSIIIYNSRTRCRVIRQINANIRKFTRRVLRPVGCTKSMIKPSIRLNYVCSGSISFTNNYSKVVQELVSALAQVQEQVQEQELAQVQEQVGYIQLFIKLLIQLRYQKYSQLSIQRYQQDRRLYQVDQYLLHMYL